MTTKMMKLLVLFGILGISLCQWAGEKDMMAAVNYLRKINNAPPLVLSTKLNQSAQRHNQFLAQLGRIDHNPPGQVGLLERMGFRAGNAGECLADTENFDANFATVILANDPPHFDIMVNPKYTHFGCAAIQVGSRVFWTQHFAVPMDPAEPGEAVPPGPPLQGLSPAAGGSGGNPQSNAPPVTGAPPAAGTPAPSGGLAPKTVSPPGADGSASVPPSSASPGTGSGTGGNQQRPSSQELKDVAFALSKQPGTPNNSAPRSLDQLALDPFFSLPPGAPQPPCNGPACSEFPHPA